MYSGINIHTIRLSNVSTYVTTLEYNKKHTTKNICHDIECNIRHLFKKNFKYWKMFQIVQNGEKCKKPKNGDFQPKITKCAPYVVYCLNQCLDICHVFCCMLYVLSCCVFGQSTYNTIFWSLWWVKK